MDLTPEAVMTGISALGGGGVVGWFLRIIYVRVATLDEKLEEHDRATVIAMASQARDAEDSRASSRELKGAMSTLTQSVDRLAILMERRA